MLLVDAAHKSGCGGKDLVDKDEDGLLGRQLDSLADDVDELANSQIGGDQVLLLVDGRDVALLDLFANDLFSAFVSTRSLESVVGSSNGSDVSDGTTQGGDPAHALDSSLVESQPTSNKINTTRKR